MTNIALKTLLRELNKKQARMDRLETLMSEKHLRAVTAKAMARFARRFNNAATTEEMIKIANEFREVNSEWENQLSKAKHQRNNYMKWMDEQLALQREISDLSSEVARLELMDSLRNPVKTTKQSEREL